MEYTPWRGVLRYARTGDQVAFMVGLKGGDQIEKCGVVVSVDDSKDDVDITKMCRIQGFGKKYKRRLTNIRIIFQFFFEDRVRSPLPPRPRTCN